MHLEIEVYKCTNSIVCFTDWTEEQEEEDREIANLKRLITERYAPYLFVKGNGRVCAKRPYIESIPTDSRRYPLEELVSYWMCLGPANVWGGVTPYNHRISLL